MKPIERGMMFKDRLVRAILEGRKSTPRHRLYVRRGEDPSDRRHIAHRLLNGIGHINEHGCWIWDRSTSAGYGCLTIGGRPVRAHRMILALVLGMDERALEEVCHDCPGGDNPLCINPRHLFHATHADNVRDAVLKGRLQPPVPPRLNGIENPAAKLTGDDLRYLRSLRSEGATQRALAVRFGVSQSNISSILRGKTRRHG